MPKAEDINKELELVYQKCLEEIENIGNLKKNGYHIIMINIYSKFI